MADTYAYDAGLPCKNPSCSSHGRPHPNCKCYGGYAKGGDVKHFCDLGRSHQEDCQYFAGGGETDFIPDSDFVPDQEQSAEQPTNSEPDFIPDDQFKPDQAESAPISAKSTSDFIPDHEFTPDEDKHEKYGGTGQMLLTGLEGVAQGVAGPLATLTEQGLNKLGVPGLTDQDIAGRQEENPLAHEAGEAAGLVWTTLLAPEIEAFTLAGRAAKAAEATAQLAELGSFGSAALKGAISTGILQASDETSKYLLGQNNDPMAAGSAILAAGVLGGAGSGLFGLASNKLLSKLEDVKLGQRAMGMSAGLGVAAQGTTWADTVVAVAKRDGVSIDDLTSELTPEHKTGIKHGEKLWHALHSQLTAGGVGATYGAYKGWDEGGISGAIHEAGKYGGISWLGGKAINKIGEKVIVPTVLKVLASDGKGVQLAHAFDNGKYIEKGIKAINHGVDNLFDKTVNRGVNAVANEYERDKVNNFVSNGGINKQMENQKNQSSSGSLGFAEGGVVPASQSNTLTAPANANMTMMGVNMQPPINGSMRSPLDIDHSTTDHQPKQIKDALAKPVISENDEFITQHYPELGMMLGTAKGRINNYLNSIRPQDIQQRLPFDAPIRQTDQKRSYNKALDIAIQPLSVLNHVKEGTLTPEHLQHFSAMYPDLHEHLKGKITEKIMKAQMEDKKPPYRIRQALSLFMGTPLDSTLTPASIQATQAVYAQQQQQAPPGQPLTKNKKGTSSLSKASEQYQTSTQASEARQRNGH